MIRFRNVQKRYGNVLHLIMESHWKNGIMMLIMCMLCFGHSQNQNSVKFINAYKSASSRFVKKGISTDQGKTLEGSVLESKFLPVDSGWCTD